MNKNNKNDLNPDLWFHITLSASADLMLTPILSFRVSIILKVCQLEAI